MARLRTWLREEGTHLVTLTGPGGCGKTRLALEIAARWVGTGRTSEGDSCPFHAVGFVPLQDLSDARSIADQVLQALRLPRSSHVAPLEQVVSVLALQPSLLLLDNFEHLLPEGAALVQALLERVEGLTLLVTSRQRLGLAGERQFPVPPLPMPADDLWLDARATGTSAVSGSDRLDQQLASLESNPSVRLFLDRARAVRPEFQLTPANASAVAAVCRRLEGLPLALELAAARADVLTPMQLLDRLTHRLDLLSRGEGQAPARHQSLRAALAWSYQLLAPELRRFFARLSVFRGGWTLAAAEAVCADVEEPGAVVVDRLSCLVARSLVLADESGGEMRYRLLETLREFAAEQLEPAEQADLARRAAAYYLALAEEAEPRLWGAAQEEWLDRLEREHDNFRRALDESLAAGAASDESEGVELGLRLGSALARYWGMRGHWAEGRARLTQLLALPAAQARTEVRAKALAAAGDLTLHQNDHELARRLHEESLGIGQQLGSQARIAHASLSLGRLAMCRGDLETARSLLEESLALWRTLANPWYEALTLNQLGRLARDQSNDAAARALYAESLALARGVEDNNSILDALACMAEIDYLVGDYAAARALYEEAVEMAYQVGFRGYLPVLLNMLGEIARCEGDYDRAASVYQESLRLWQALGDRLSLAGTLVNLGYVAMRQREDQRARTLFTEGLTTHRRLKSRRGMGIGLAGMAGLAVAAGDPIRAAQWLGAVAAWLEAAETQFWSADRTEYERDLATVRAALGATEFATAWAEGQMLSLEQAVADALGEKSDRCRTTCDHLTRRLGTRLRPDSPVSGPPLSRTSRCGRPG
jgi:predicted ATPase